jgi:hypothetical protein
MLGRFIFSSLAVILLALPAHAQLEADAVQLDKVKIPEAQKSVDLCPVYLEPSDPALPVWTYKDVTYRGSRADAKEKFFQKPDQYAEAAKRQRFINNFMLAMSTVWCPVTDQVTPGGMKQWKKHGHTWESCCAFCDENAKEEDFARGLEILKKRAEESYKLMGAKYTEGASSPVEGAIKIPKN